MRSRSQPVAAQKQPSIQCLQILKFQLRREQPLANMLNLVLDLTFLPARCWRTGWHLSQGADRSPNPQRCIWRPSPRTDGAAVRFRGNARACSLRMSSGPARDPSDQGGKTSDTPGSDALLHTTGAQTGYPNNIPPTTCGSAVRDLSKGGQCCCKTARDVDGCRTDQQTDQSTAADDPVERGRLSRTHKTVRLALLATVFASGTRSPRPSPKNRMKDSRSLT
jgi:hypothetical protein